MTPAPWLEVDLGPGVRAGFSTAWLGNLGLAVGEEPAVVRARRRAVEVWAGGPVAWGRQVHGNRVHDATAGGDDVAECDAMVSGDVGLAVLVADCVPVLLADPGTGLVGVAHAGRAGVLADVVGEVVTGLRDRGARDLLAAVGPAVCGSCYEVPDALREEVVAVAPAAAGTTSWGTPALDLPAAVLARLAGLGVPAQHLARCTRTDPDLFSHRRVTTGRPEVTGPGRTAGRTAGVVRLV